jgi:histidine decarboxylase
MTRRHNVTKLSNQIEYIGSVDSTIMGSRNGHTALFVWNALATKGIRGLEEEARLCIQNAKYMKDSLTENGVSNVLLNNWSCTVVMPRPTSEFVRRWQLACTDDIAHVVIMPNVTPIKIDTFVSAYIEDRALSRRDSNKETRPS